jgi:hypothetical protein
MYNNGHGGKIMAKPIILTAAELGRCLELVSSPADIREYRMGVVGSY